MSVVTLYGRAGCHLCDEARAAIVALRDSFAHGFEIQEIDIDTDERLQLAYMERVPVVCVDGEVIAELWLDPDALAAKLHTLRS